MKLHLNLHPHLVIFLGAREVKQVNYVPEVILGLRTRRPIVPSETSLLSLTFFSTDVNGLAIIVNFQYLINVAWY